MNNRSSTAKEPPPQSIADSLLTLVMCRVTHETSRYLEGLPCRPEA